MRIISKAIAYAKNIARRHLPMAAKCAFGEAWADDEKRKAKERYEQRPVGGRGNKVEGNVSLDFEPQQSRDAIAERIGSMRFDAFSDTGILLT